MRSLFDLVSGGFDPNMGLPPTAGTPPWAPGAPPWATPGINPMAGPQQPQGPFSMQKIIGGLFGDDPKGTGDARMAAAAALLMSSGYQPTKTTNAEAIGRALMASQQARNQALEAAQKRRLTEAQIAAAGARAAPERVDLGDAWGILDNNGNIVSRIQKGISPETSAAQQAAAQERITDREFRSSMQEDAQTAQAEQNRLAREAAAAGRGSKTTPTEADAQTKLGQVNAARGSLVKVTESSGALNDLQTGPIVGRRPAITDAEQTFQADVAAVTAQILAATKVPGTGMQSDRDAVRLDALTPQLTDDKAARNRKIIGIRAWLDEIEATNRGLAGGKASTGSADIEALLNKYAPR